MRERIKQEWWRVVRHKNLIFTGLLAMTLRFLRERRCNRIILVLLKFLGG